MKHLRILLLTAMMSCVCLTSFAVRPKWVGNTPKELNNTYCFIEIVAYGSDISSARMESVTLLAQNEQLRRAVDMKVKSGNRQKIEQKIVDGDMRETITDNIIIEKEISGQQYRLQAYPVDEYIEHDHGQLKLHTLYMVGISDNVVFDHAYKTTSYGVAPALMSVIPGLGQFYKGSTIKGICMLAGVAACGVGALFCENERADYKNMIKEQPQFAQKYNTKANNWETARNVCIGAAAALWVYNIIDAAATKGARKIVVKPGKANYLSMHPIVTPNAGGVSLTYNF